MIDKKFQTQIIVTDEGKLYCGVVVYEDDEPHEPGRELPAPRGAGPTRHQGHDPPGAPGSVEDAEHSPEQEREDKDRDMITVGESAHDIGVEGPQESGEGIGAPDVSATA